MSQVMAFGKKFALPLWKWYAAGVVALAVTNLITLLIPQLAKVIINAFADGSDVSSLEGKAGLIIGLGMLTILIRAFSRIFIFWPGRKLEANSKSYIFEKMMALPQSFYDRFGMGELISRLTNDIGQLRAFFAFGVLQLLNLLFLLSFTITMMISIHPNLTAAALLPLLLMVFFMKHMMTFMHNVSLENQQAVGRLTNKVTEAFVNVHVIKSNAAEQTFEQRADKENEDVYRTNIKQVLLRTAFFPLLGALMNLSQVAVIFYGGYEVIKGNLTVGDILAFNVYITYLAFPLSALGIFISLFQRCRTALSRLQEIESVESERTHTDIANIAATDLLLKVENLSFKFPGSDNYALSNISFTVKPGQHIGLFGPIGSGKTTLFDLISRLHDPEKGSIYFESKDILGINPQTLRHDVGYVQQTAHLFSDTVAKNLSFGVKDYSEKMLEQAASKAQILEEIEKFDQGWETEIGEKGIRLSGGQKQRLALARIMLREPKLYLLDDVLSAVDHTTEKKLIDSISQTNSAAIIASHRASALQHCDTVLVMSAGKIVDQGTFEELYSRNPGLFEAEDVG